MHTSLNYSEANFLRESYLDSLRDLLPRRIAEAPEEVAWHHLKEAYSALTPAQQQGFAVLSMQNASENILRDMGRNLSGIARTIAPVAQVAAPLVGTMIGGPAGAMLGSGLGNLIGGAAGQGSATRRTAQGAGARGRTRAQSPAGLGQMLGQIGTGGIPQSLGSLSQILGGVLQAPSTRTSPAAPSAPPPPAAPAPNTPNPAAAQLMALLANPQLIQALLAQVLGTTGMAGAATVQQSTGEEIRIPFAELMSTLGECALRAAAESVKLGTYESEDYLTDRRGNYLVTDTNDPSERADYVMNLLDASFLLEHEDGPESSHDEVTEWFIGNGMIQNRL